MKKVNFQVAKVQPQVLLAPGVAVVLLVFFCQFQPDITYKSVAYKKSMCFGFSPS